MSQWLQLRWKLWKSVGRTREDNCWGGHITLCWTDVRLNPSYEYVFVQMCDNPMLMLVNAWKKVFNGM